jgi:multidrug efflux pump subunit AcrA (membrane-fusion protein)
MREAPLSESRSLIVSSPASTSGQVAVFQSETQAVLAQVMPRRSFGFLYMLCAMLLVALLLMALVSLDRVVTGAGTITPVEGSLFVQPLDRAIVREIRVREGDVVKKGQILATLDPTFAKANLEQYEMRGVANRAMVERLQAEVDGRAYVPKPGDADADLQMSIYNQRQAELRQSVTDFDARIAALRTSEARARTNAGNYGQQLAIATRIRDMRSELEAKGFGSKLNTMIATSDRTSVERQMQESQHEATQIRSELAALHAQRDAFVSKWKNDAAVQLAEARRQLNDDKGEATKARRISDYINLVAPRTASCSISARPRSAPSSSPTEAPNPSSPSPPCAAGSKPKSPSAAGTSGSSNAARRSPSSSTPTTSSATAPHRAPSPPSAKDPSPTTPTAASATPSSRSRSASPTPPSITSLTTSASSQA